jgi:hypothetical protein
MLAGAGRFLPDRSMARRSSSRQNERVGGGCETEPDPIAIDGHDPQANLVADGNLFPRSSTQD